MSYHPNSESEKEEKSSVSLLCRTNNTIAPCICICIFVFLYLICICIYISIWINGETVTLSSTIAPSRQRLILPKTACFASFATGAEIGKTATLISSNVQNTKDFHLAKTLLPDCHPPNFKIHNTIYKAFSLVLPLKQLKSARLAPSSSFPTMYKIQRILTRPTFGKG